MEGENNGDSLSAGVETPASPEAKTNKVATPSLEKCFVQVQGILDQNRLLINEINQNHQSGEHDNLGRNVALIRELNTNISRVVELYEDLSLSFTKSVSGNLVSLSQRSKACQKKVNLVHLSQGSGSKACQKRGHGEER